MKIKKLSIGDTIEVTYTLVHVHEKDVIEQDVTLTKEGNSWTTTITIPRQRNDSPNSVMVDLGQLFYRLSEEIMYESEKFSIIELDKLET